MRFATVGKLLFSAVLTIFAASCATSGELRTLEARMERAEQRVEQLASTLATVELQLSTIQSSLGDVNSRLAIQSGRIKEIASLARPVSPVPQPRRAR